MGNKHKAPLMLVQSRIPSSRYRELLDLLTKSQNPTMSSLIRDVLSNKTIVCKTHDETYDLLMDRILSIQMEIHAIGVNINQVTRYFNSLEDPLRKKVLVKKLEKLLTETGIKVDGLEKLVTESLL
ncbi:hypothetical protein KZP23_17145 [Echinicola marina]|uniref:plasmid mobilization protein n=1 Tax=Echinicola marina TaxID=2859768 RepID=UPI001CF714DA|nr:hypothetical protein [Echinicola marina]UCS92411.1 hypothetical protein KZP23_17145 [Echinicola marina]